MREIKCLNCSKPVKNKFCSRLCYYEHKRNNPYPGQFNPGHSGMIGEANPIWKGDKVGYTALHEWLYLHFGKPSLCEECGSTAEKKYEWANISKLYKRERSDWQRLCVSCHRLKDGHGYKMWETRRSHA